MAFKPRPSFKALATRYHAGRKAVKAGADPALTLSLVIWPTPDIEAASRGELRGRRLLTDEEERLHYNERVRRHNAPASKRWKKAA